MASFLGGAMRALSRSSKEEAWNPVESLALAPMGGFWLDAAMGLAPDIPEIPEEYYEAAQ